MILWFIAWFLFFSTLPSFSFLIVRRSISNYNLIFHWWKTYNSSFTFSITLTLFLNYTHTSILFNNKKNQNPTPSKYNILLYLNCLKHATTILIHLIRNSYYYFDRCKYEDDAWYHVVLLLDRIENGMIQLPTI